MAVRVKLRIRSKSSGIEVETSALVNSGYETDEPELLVPRRLAEFLRIPLTPPRGRAVLYETPFGVYTLIYVERELEVHLVDVCCRVDNVHVAVAEHEREVLISDKLASALGIQLIDIGLGLWRHRGDPLDAVRSSVSPQYW